MNIQEAIDLAVKENRIVYLRSSESNDTLRKEVTDLKGCRAFKGKPEDKWFSVHPPESAKMICEEMGFPYP